MPEPDRGERGVVAIVACAAALMFLWLALPASRGEVFIEHDAGAIFLPLRYFYAQCLAAGDSFLWIPNIYMGMYLHGEGQTAMTHPLHWALYKALPFPAAFDLEFLLSYPFMFAGMLLFLRRRGLEPAAVLFGAIAFTFGGYAMNSWIWLVHVGTLAHAPWLLWCIDIVLREPRPRKATAAALGVVALTASAALKGYPQMVVVMGLAEGLYALMILRESRGIGRYLWLFANKLLGLACAAIQLLPMLDLLGDSTRIGAGDAFRLQQSLHPMNLLSLVNPYLYHQRMFDGNGYQGLYGGAVMTLAAVWIGLRFRRLAVPKTLAAAGIALAGLGAAMALGRYGFVYPVFAKLPIIESFRGPARFGGMFHIGWTLLGALSIAEILCMRRARAKSTACELAPLVVLPILSAAMFAIVTLGRALDGPAWFTAIEHEFGPARNAAIGACVMIAATVAFIAAARGARGGLAVLVIIATADLAVYGLRHRTTQEFGEFVAAIDVPDAPPEYRIAPDWLPVYNVNGPLINGYSMAAGLVSIEPRRHLEYYVNPRNLQLAGVKWLRARYGTNDELNAAFDRGETWIELPEPMPRARLVPSARVDNNYERLLDEIDLLTETIVDAPISLGGDPGVAVVTLDRPGRIDVRTNAPAPQLLVLTEAFDDGWRVAIDHEDSSTPIPVYGDFLGCVVPPGEHTVRFTFAPESWRWGKVVSLWAVVVAFVLHATVLWIGTRKH